MQSLSLTSGAFAVPLIDRCAARLRPGWLVPIEAIDQVEPTARWRLRRGCGGTFEVYDGRGAYLGQLVAPLRSAPESGGDTVYLDRTHLSVLRD